MIVKSPNFSLSLIRRVQEFCKKRSFPIIVWVDRVLHGVVILLTLLGCVMLWVRLIFLKAKEKIKKLNVEKWNWKKTNKHPIVNLKKKKPKYLIIGPNK